MPISTACSNIPNPKGCLVDNPDVTGIGVRVAFYIQAYLTILVAFLPGADVKSSYWSMTVTAVALFISALALLHQKALSLYLAISVSILLSLHAFAATLVLIGGAVTGKRKFADIDRPTDPERKAFNRSMRSLRFWSYPVVIVAQAFSLFMWQKAPTFGPAKYVACNPQTVVVIIGSHLNATEGGRTAGLVISYASIACLLLFLIFDVSIILIGLNNRRVLDKGVVDSFLTVLGGKWDAVSRTRRPPRFLETIQGIFSFFIPRKVKHVVRDISPGTVRSLAWFGLVVVMTLLIVSNELTLRANCHLLQDAQDGRQWALGQIFPVVMLLVPLYTVLRFALGPSSSQ